MLNNDASIAFLGQTHFEGNQGGIGRIITLENCRPSMISGNFCFWHETNEDSLRTT